MAGRVHHFGTLDKCICTHVACNIFAKQMRGIYICAAHARKHPLRSFMPRAFVLGR